MIGTDLFRVPRRRSAGGFLYGLPWLRQVLRQQSSHGSGRKGHLARHTCQHLSRNIDTEPTLWTGRRLFLSHLRYI